MSSRVNVPLIFIVIEVHTICMTEPANDFGKKTHWGTRSAVCIFMYHLIIEDLSEFREQAVQSERLKASISLSFRRLKISCGQYNPSILHSGPQHEPDLCIRSNTATGIAEDMKCRMNSSRKSKTMLRVLAAFFVAITRQKAKPLYACLVRGYFDRLTTELAVREQRKQNKISKSQ